MRTAFPAVQCGEGFRCVSRVGVFGSEHVGPVGPRRSPGGKEARWEYEWGCPYKEPVSERLTWSQSGYEVDANACADVGDCLCVSRGSMRQRVTRDAGQEKVLSAEDVQMPFKRAQDPPHMEELALTPHHKLRLLPPIFNAHDPHADMGSIEELPTKAWLDAYQVQAPRLQSSLDDLHRWLDKTYKDNFEDEAWVCGDRPPSTPPGTKPSFASDLPIVLAQSRIRRYQILSSDCEAVRAKAAQVAPSAKEELFSAYSPWPKDSPMALVAALLRRRGGAAGSPTAAAYQEYVGERRITGKPTDHERLNCNMLDWPPNKNKSSLKCQQLNCYRGDEDALFLTHLQEMKDKLNACRSDSEQQPAAKAVEAQGPPLEAAVAGFPPLARRAPRRRGRSFL